MAECDRLSYGDSSDYESGPAPTDTTADRILTRLADAIEAGMVEASSGPTPVNFRRVAIAALSSHGLREAVERVEDGCDIDYRPNSMDKEYGHEGDAADAHALKIYARHLEINYKQARTALLGEGDGG